MYLVFPGRLTAGRLPLEEKVLGSNPSPGARAKFLSLDKDFALFLALARTKYDKRFVLEFYIITSSVQII